MHTEILFILDRSGSMAGLEKDTIGGFNSMLQKQKQVEGSVTVTTILFDNEIEYLTKNPVVKDFLEAELDLCRLVQEISQSIAEAIDFE